MGNYRFKLSDMMPKSWFCKLKEFGKNKSQGSLSKTKKKLSATSSSTIKPLSPRQSYYYSLDHSREKLYNSPLNPKTPDTHFPDPPRKSKRKARKRTSVSSPKIVTSISSACGCHNTVNSVWKSENFPGSPISTDSFDHTTDWIDSCNSKNPSSETDIIFHLNNQKSFMKNSDHVDGCKSCNPISELELHPILTRPQKNDELIVQMKKKEEKPAKFEKKTDESLAFLPEKKQRSLSRCPEPKTTRKRSNSVSSPGLKLRSSSPRLGSKKIQVNLASRRKSFSQSFAVVKSSFDPQRDFKESMVEMIMENNIRSSKDLEDLLVCYLSLNSNEYHDVIVKVFKQIWFELTDIRL